MSEATELTCQRIEALLFDLDLGAFVVAGEHAALQRHLHSCPDCQAFAEVLDRLPASLIADENSLAPDPRLKPRLHLEVHGRSAPRASSRPRALDRPRVYARGPMARLRELVDVRVPAYQALLGASAVAAVLIAFAHPTDLPGRSSGLDLFTEAGGPGPAQQSAVAYTRRDSDEVRAKMGLLDHVGTNRSLDSLVSAQRLLPAGAGGL